MAILVQDLKPLRLYSSGRKLYLPFDEENKKKGSAIFLMTPNIDSSIRTMNLDYLINHKSYESYYIEKDVSYIINHENHLVRQYENEFEFIMESINDIAQDDHATIKFGSTFLERAAYDRTFIDIEKNTQYIKLNMSDKIDLAAVDDMPIITSIDEYNTFVTSDLHLFQDANHGMTYVDDLIRKINIKIKPHQNLVICGDLMDTGDLIEDTKKLKYFISNIKTKNVILILGNNDVLPMHTYYECGIKYVTDRLVVGKYTFTHYPENVPHDMINFCGHLHSSITYWNVDPKYCINVGYANNKNNKNIYTIKEFLDKKKNGDYDDCRMVYKDMHELLESVSENMIFSKDDVEINLDLWGKDKYHNILFITGFSGSGKSTLAKRYQSSDITAISLDTLWHGSNETGSIYEYIYNNCPSYKKYIDSGKAGAKDLPYEVKLYKIETLAYIMNMAEKDFLNRRYVMEGIQIYRDTPREMIYGRPLIIKGTSAFISALNRLRREDGFTTSVAYKGIFQYFKWYSIDNSILKSFEKKVNKHNSQFYADRDWTGEYTLESVVEKLEDTQYNPGYLIGEDAKITTIGLQGKDRMILFNEMLDEDVFYEATHSNNAVLKRLLYDDRIRTTNELNDIYKNIKAKCPWIRYTRYQYKLYDKKNLFIDTSYYTQSFFKNNFYKLDKAAKLYFDYMDRYLDDKRLTEAGYNNRYVFIPISDWAPTSTGHIWNYRETINPISVIYYMLKNKRLEALKTSWGKYKVVFLGDTGYFTIDWSTFEEKNIMKFKVFCDQLVGKHNIEEEPDETPETYDSTKAITTEIIDKIEKTQHIKIDYITGKKGQEEEITKTKLNDKIDKSNKNFKDTGSPKTKLEIEREEKKKQLVDRIETVAARANTTDEAIEDLDNDEFVKQLLIDLAAEEDNQVKMSAARASRMVDLNTKFHEKKIKGTSVKNLLDEYGTSGTEELTETSLPIETINDEWHHLKFTNFNKDYNLNEDIIAILDFFSTRTDPVAVRDINVENTTTSEDIKETWTVNMEDAEGARFTLKFDIPLFKSGNLLRLRGNDKALSGQLMNLPVIKTDLNTCQITSNYNKIFISVFGSTIGKSYESTDRIIKALNKMKSTDRIKISYGDNHIISSKYELPIDYIDMSNLYTTIEVKVEGKYHTFYFNQDIIREKVKVDESKGLPCGIDYLGNVIYCTSGTFTDYMLNHYLFDVPEFRDAYNETKPGVKYAYSKASILNTEIPIIVVMGYSEGLITALQKANIKYMITDKNPKTLVKDVMKRVEEGTPEDNDDILTGSYDIIKFADGYIAYALDYNSSLLMNGLKECDTTDYSIKEINTKAMWINFLDEFGGRIKSDGLDNFYDLMVDPITKRVCEEYDIPTDYCEMLAYANLLLSDNKYNKTTDVTGNRYRYAEIIAAHTYKCLAKSYSDYHTMKKRANKATMSIKQSAVLDSILTDNTLVDSSTTSEITYVETANSVSFRGLSGLNSERSYNLEKRTYDESMINLVALSTGFASTVGINRQTTIDMNIKGTRGYIKTTTNTDDMNDVKTLCMTEALTPFGTTSDDPFRTAMTYIQTSKHSMRIAHGRPNLVTDGADDAIAYMSPDIFSYNSKGNGKVLQLTDTYMILEYDDGSHDFVDLREKVYKNSDGGFFVTIKLDTNLKEGNRVKSGQVVAYDKLSYTTNIGYDDNPTFNNGILAKIAVLTTSEGYEDSGIMSYYLADAMSSDIVVEVERTLPKNSNVYNIVKKGQPIQEGDPLLIYQNAFDDNDVNILLKNLTDDVEEINELGRIYLKSKVTGIVQDIVIYRTVEKTELSSSLRKIVDAYESDINKTKKIIEKYSPEQAMQYDSTEKLEATGKLKDAADSVKIVFYLKFKDDLKVGDKMVMSSALKSVIQDIFPEGQEPSSEYRPDEPIESFLGMASVNKRMVTSVLKNGMINKAMIELDRHVKEMYGIKWKNLREI